MLVLIAGTIIGETSKPVTTVFIRKSATVNPSAVSVPSRVAKIAAETATMRLVPSASRQASATTGCSYHWVDSNPMGGPGSVVGAEMWRIGLVWRCNAESDR